MKTTTASKTSKTSAPKTSRKAAPAPAAASKAKAAAAAPAAKPAAPAAKPAAAAAKPAAAAKQYKHDPRIPAVGQVIEKLYRPRGQEPQTLKVTVLADGFRFRGEHYTSLSKIATDLCGMNHNGIKFFGLIPSEKAAK